MKSAISLTVRWCLGVNVGPSDLRSVCLVGLLLSLWSFSAFAEQLLDRLVYFAIPANINLEDALIDWGTACKLTVMINTNSLDKRIVTHGVYGTLSARKAISLILKDSGLSYAEDGEKILVVPTATLTKSGIRSETTSSEQSTASDFEQLTPPLVQEGGGKQRVDGQNGYSEEARGFSEVVVTAQKISQRAQDVPETIGVLSGADLESHGLVALLDYAKEIPGLDITSGTGRGGGPGYGYPVIRGMSTGNAGGTALVAIFLDDIPVTASGGLNAPVVFDPDVVGIEHVEVLEGPQATLYGASAEGGIIKYVTKPVDLNNFSGSVRADGSQIDGGGAGYGVRGSANIPIVSDTIAADASVFYREDPGFVGNAYNDTKNQNWDSVKGGRLAVRFKISDVLETTLSGIAQNIYAPGLNRVFLNPQNLKPMFGALEYSTPMPQTIHVDVRLVADTIKWNLQFATLTNVASYFDIYENDYQDSSLYGSFVGAPPDVGGRFLNIGGQTSWTDELRLASNPGRVEYLMGAFYSSQKTYNNEINRGTTPNGDVLGPADPFFNIFTYRSDATFSERALFGNLTYHLTDQIEGTVGLRRSWYGNSSIAHADGLLATINQNLSGSDSSNSYLATILYKPTSTLTAYLRAASAYRPGYPQSLNSVQEAAGAKPEIGADLMWDYEVGVKGAFLSEFVRYSVSAFRMRWSDLQLSVISDGTSYGANVGGAQSTGAEASVQFMPVKGLNVDLKGAYIDAKITADIPNINAASGQPLPYSPKWTAAGVIDYHFSIPNGVIPTVGLTYAYHGQSNNAFAGTAGIFGAAGGVYTLPSYATLDVRGGFEWSRYEAFARVVNATNKYGLTAAANSPFAGYPLTGVVIQPRTFGISFAAHY